MRANPTELGYHSKEHDEIGGCEVFPRCVPVLYDEAQATDTVETNWVRSSRSLPAAGTPVLVTDGKSVLVGECEVVNGFVSWVASGVDGHEWEWEFDDYEDQGKITHWMPLPQPPAKS